jgi:hypothetical protein
MTDGTLVGHQRRAYADTPLGEGAGLGFEDVPGPPAGQADAREFFLFGTSSPDLRSW